MTLHWATGPARDGRTRRTVVCGRTVPVGSIAEANVEAVDCGNCQRTSILRGALLQAAVEAAEARAPR